MQYNLLLNRISSIIKVYEKHAELSGEKFNIFSIMGMDSDEVRTHSAILGELLNSKGNHSLGSKPLELFVKYAITENEEGIENKEKKNNPENDIFELKYENSICQKELHIGKINEDKTEGGRIDLIVKDNTGIKLVIENKIYAPEQENQLTRYNNKYGNAKILYLTLDGDKSKKEVDFEYYKVSYKTDILNWIEACAKEAFDKPMVREVLNQYTYLLKKLTNQTTNTEMKDELKEVIKNNYTESLEIYKNFEEVRQDYVSEIFEKIKKQKIQSKNIDWKIEFDNDEFNIWGSDKSTAILFLNQEKPSVYFYLRYEYKKGDTLYLGIVSEETKKLLKKSIQRESLKYDIDFINEYIKKGDVLITETVDKIKTYIENNIKVYENNLK